MFRVVLAHRAVVSEPLLQMLLLIINVVFTLVRSAESGVKLIHTQLVHSLVYKHVALLPELVVSFLQFAADPSLSRLSHRDFTHRCKSFVF